MVITNITNIMKKKVTTKVGVRLGTKNVVITGRSNSIRTCMFSLWSDMAKTRKIEWMKSGEHSKRFKTEQEEISLVRKYPTLWRFGSAPHHDEQPGGRRDARGFGSWEGRCWPLLSPDTLRRSVSMCHYGLSNSIESEKKEVMKKTSREDFLPKIIYLSMFRHNFNTTHEETIFIHFTIRGGLMEKYTLISGPPALRARRKPERRSQTWRRRAPGAPCAAFTWADDWLSWGLGLGEMMRSGWSWIDLCLCKMIAARYVPGEMKLIRRQEKIFHNKLPQVAFSDDCSWHNWSQLTFWHFFHFVFLSLCLYVFLYCYPFASFTIDTTNPFREIFPAFFFDVKKHQLYISYYTQDGQYGWFEETRQWKFSKVKIFSFWVLLCCNTIPPIHRALTAVFVAESQGRST